MKNKVCSFILLSGGRGSRMHNSIPKQYMMLAGKPIIVHILERIDDMPEIDDVVVVCKEEYYDLVRSYIVNYSLKKEYCLVAAGESRQESVYNGLKAARRDRVLLHEAARPFVKKEEFRALINDTAENITCGYPISYTVLQQENNMISGLLERSKLVNIQLPQKFNRTQLLACHMKAIQEGKLFTEDAGMLYYYEDVPIKVIEGKDYNLKITNPADVIVGEKIHTEYFINQREAKA